MKKIAILTFHRACNFGAFLQAYALQYALRNDANADAYILDYDCAAVSKDYTVVGRLRARENFLKKVVALSLQLPDILKRNRAFSRARKSSFRIMGEPIPKEALPNAVSEYDCFVVGSDQVWNREITGQDNAFFLDFVTDPRKKYSYAASIGHARLTADVAQEFANLLKDFQKVSLREPECIPELQNRLKNCTVQCNIDPVFLPGAEHWRHYMQRVNRKPYVLFFTLQSDKTAENTMRFAKKMAEEKGVEALYLSNAPQWFRMRALKHFGAAGPEQFVGLIDGAEYVVTNSFHATAFCIILHKQFFVETNISRSSRITHLLKICGLSDRVLVNGTLPQRPSAIDWDLVDARLAGEIGKAKEYLKEIVTAE